MSYDHGTHRLDKHGDPELLGQRTTVGIGSWFPNLKPMSNTNRGRVGHPGLVGSKQESRKVIFLASAGRHGDQGRACRADGPGHLLLV